MTVSIIIPVLDDNKELEILLSSLRAWKKQAHEIIVVDALAQKECKNICNKYSARWLAYNKSRGAQMRFGAHHADADTLWFLYADCIPHPDSLDAIEHTMNTDSKGGFFKFSFNREPKELTHNLIEFFTNWRSKNFSVYGDQGLFFDKQAYFVLDGHADQTLFEEVKLVKKFRSLKFQYIDLPIQISPRKWERDGYWTRTWRNRRIALRHSLGTETNILKNEYYSNKL